MAYTTGERRTTITLGARFAEVFRDMGDSYAKWRVYRKTLNALQGLSTRELDDLGLNRAAIIAAATKAAYGDAR